MSAATLLAAALLCSAAHAECLTPIELTIEGVAHRATQLHIDFGPTYAGAARMVQIGVRNRAGGSLAVAAFTTNCVTNSTWNGGARLASGPANVVLLDADNGATVDVTVDVPMCSGFKTPMGSLLLRTSADEEVSVWFTFQPMAYRTIDMQSTSGSMPSPDGIGFSGPYVLCSGPPPPGYTIDVANSTFAVSGDRNRSCGNWCRCHPQGIDPEKGLCYTFEIQGHFESTFPIPTSESVNAEGTLRTRFKLVETSPTITNLACRSTFE